MRPFSPFLLVLGFFLLPQLLSAQQVDKPPLDHTVYESWTRLSGVQLSHDGNWTSYVIAPQRHDGYLYRRQLPEGTKDSLPRGNDPRFAADASFLAFRIKAPFDSLRQEKLKKTPKDKMPKDSLGLWQADGNIEKIPQLSSFALPKDAGDWVAFQLHELQMPTDSSQQDSLAAKGKKGKAKGKKDAKPLLVYQPASGQRDTFEQVTAYTCADAGNWLGFITAFGDSIDSTAVKVFVPDTRQSYTLYEGPGLAKSLTFDRAGEQVAFLLSTDTAQVKVFELWYGSGRGEARKLIDGSTSGMPEGWTVSEHGKLMFSESGSRLFLGTQPRPENPPEDSLPDDEKVKVDVWNWQDSRLQPQQLKQLEEDKKRHYLAVYHLEDKKLVQLADETVHRVRLTLKGDGDYALGVNTRKYEKLISWESPSYRDAYAVDVKTGEKKLLLERKQYSLNISTGGNYLSWYEPKEQAWYAMPTQGGPAVNLTGKLKVNFFNEDHDTPNEPYPYGITGWGEEDAFVIIQDRYDLWKIDPIGQEKAVNLSQKVGRKNNIRFRYLKLDPEALFVEKEMLLQGFDEDDKSESWYRISSNGSEDPEALIRSDHHYSGLMKARDADRLLWRRQEISAYPDLWTSKLDFSAPQRLSAANPQQEAYNWASVEHLTWKVKKEKREALLYRPEDFDPARKYPLMVYFYERNSRTLHYHRSPTPSRSTINPIWYASNGYLVLIPDIRYKTGQPGPDALEYVNGAVDHVLEAYDYIDPERMAIQGQSWGGYQVAYMVTQTDRYAAAMAGAPVSNMTSAYGGIRWGSGLSRMFQYEETQSRLGTTLWEDRARYLNNSPLFFAPQVNTPLLMMHNDKDGAVPWYQGIELFVALRRLQKPSWLLVYNGEKHNLTQWPNRIDLSIRMAQFFDHYLKGAEAPPWMTEGLPATEKGKNLGY
jgi:acetyl esterase/lipase